MRVLLALHFNAVVVGVSLRARRRLTSNFFSLSASPRSAKADIFQLPSVVIFSGQQKRAAKNDCLNFIYDLMHSTCQQEKCITFVHIWSHLEELPLQGQVWLHEKFHF